MKQIQGLVPFVSRVATVGVAIAVISACGSTSDNNGGGDGTGGMGVAGEGGASTGGSSDGSGGAKPGTGGKSSTGGKSGTGGKPGTGGGSPTSCDPDPCVYGTCAETSKGVTCSCELGWSGELCNTPIVVTDHCDPNPCQNDGLCENQNDGFECVCGPGWSGETCTTDIPVVDHCTPNECQHGVCINHGESFSCECDFGWNGALCDAEANLCDPSPCQNGGLCTPTLEGAKCECLAGFTGPKCNQTVDNACTPNPCQHGTCESTLGGAVCHCDAGYSGDSCDTAVDDPCAPNPCVNGTCQADGAMATCDCFTGWKGATCDTVIPNVPSNPILQLKNCSIEMVAGDGWTDAGDGIFKASGIAGLNLGDAVLSFGGSDLVYDENLKSFSGTFTSLPFPAMDFLSGSALSFPAAQLASTSIMTGAQIKAALNKPETPIPDDLELLAFQLKTPHPHLGISGSTGLDVKMDEDVQIGFYLDPCDPLSYLTLSDKVMPAVGPVQLSAFGSSVEKHLSGKSAVDLWNGETTQSVTMDGHAYLSGVLSLEAIAGVPLDLDGNFLVDVDPNRDGSLNPDVFGKFFTDGDIVGAATGLAATATDFKLLGNGQVQPSLPFIAGEVAQFFQDAVGLRLDLANASVFYDNGSLYFRGISNTNLLDGTPIADFMPQNPTTDLMGYVRSETNWGIKFQSDAHFIPGGPGYASTYNLLMSDTAPSLTIDTQIDFGTIDFIPGVTIPLGSVPMSFSVDFATGDVCGETGYTSSEFTCTIEVCVGENKFEFNPTCELPSGFLCVDDSMCISDSCSNLIPESGCSAACDGVQLTCRGACEATGAACDGTCTATEATCKGACTAAAATCGAGCVATDATCNGACTATGETCRGVCDGAQGACDVGCTAAQATCDGACNVTQSACNGACTATGEVCRGPCNATESACNAGCSAASATCGAGCEAAAGTCDAGCYAGTGACEATYGTCYAGCYAACWWTPFGWTCDRDSCLNGCSNAKSSCEAAIVNPCRNACQNTRNSCYQGCNNGLSNCNGSCASTGNSCRGACNSAQSSCSNACSSTGNSCHNGCASGLSGCKATCKATGDSCRGPCNSVEGDCHSECAETTADCNSDCATVQDGCNGPCTDAGNNCHAGCDSAFDNCAAPCDSARAGCVAGCELVGTCD